MNTSATSIISRLRRQIALFFFPMELSRGPEVTAILWAILALCLVTLVYLLVTPEDKQQEAKEAADAHTAEILQRPQPTKQTKKKD